MNAAQAVQAGFEYLVVLGWVFAIAGSALMVAVAVAIGTDRQPQCRHRAEQPQTGCRHMDTEELTRGVA